MNPRHPRASLAVRLSLCVAAMLAVTAACGDEGTGSALHGGTLPDSSPSNSPKGPHGTAAPTSTPSTPAAPSPQEPRLIAYAGGESPGVEVQARADAQNLIGAPASFKHFIGSTAQRLADGTTCSDGYAGVTVETLRTDGYAVGGVHDCGGYAALWAVVDGRWKEILATQDAWDCPVLERYQVPSDVVGTTCYDYAAQKERTYQQS